MTAREIVHETEEATKEASMEAVKLMNSDHIEDAQWHRQGEVIDGYVGRCPFKGCSFETRFTRDRGMAEAVRDLHVREAHGVEGWR